MPTLNRERRRFVESGELLPLQHNTILVTGGCTGIGAGIAKKIYGLGAEIILLTRNPVHFQNVSDQIGGPGVFPLIAGINDKKRIETEMTELHDAGITPTSLILSHAGGMDPFAGDMARMIIGLSKVSIDDFPNALEKAKNRLLSLAETNLEFAKTVNFSGTVDFINEVFSEPSNTPRKIIFLSSFWASFYDEGIPVPSFYKGVAISKNMMEKYLEENSREMHGKNIHPSVVSGNLVPDTTTGKLLLAFSERLKKSFPDLVLPDLGNLPLSDDMGNAVVQLLLEDPQSWSGLKRLYVISPTECRDYLSKDDQVLPKEQIL